MVIHVGIVSWEVIFGGIFNEFCGVICLDYFVGGDWLRIGRYFRALVVLQCLELFQMRFGRMRE